MADVNLSTVLFYLVCLGAVLHESQSTAIVYPTTCAHHHHCPRSQCCMGYDDFLSLSWGPRRGYCTDFKTEGHACTVFALFDCGCLPGLSCLPVDGSVERYQDVDRVCTNTSAPYVRPASGALCSQTSECPAADECCVPDTNRFSYDIMPMYGSDRPSGKCERYTKEGDDCVTWFGCGCAPGLECALPTGYVGGGSVYDRVCVNQTSAD